MRYLQEEENIQEEDLDELDGDAQNIASKKSMGLKEGPQTYRFEQLADLIIDKDENSYGDVSDSEDGDVGDSQLLGVSGLRMRPQISSHSEEASKRMSAGSLAPGI